MTNYKQLCAELVDDLELCDWPYKLKGTIRADIARARATLAEDEPEPPTDDPYLDNCSKAVLDRARQIDKMLAVNVYGYHKTEPDACASSWFTSKLIANLEERISIIEELQEEIRGLRIHYLRMANAVACIMPDRAKFFADLNPDSDD